MISKLSSPLMAGLPLLVACSSGKEDGTFCIERAISFSTLMAHENARVLQHVHAAADVGPRVQYGDQEAEGGVGHVSRRTQHRSDTAAQQLAMEVPWIDGGNGP